MPLGCQVAAPVPPTFALPVKPAAVILPVELTVPVTLVDNKFAIS
jgi:hypothetical protein